MALEVLNNFDYSLGCLHVCKVLIKLEKVSRIRLMLLRLAESYDYFATKREDLMPSGPCCQMFADACSGMLPGSYCLFFLGMRQRRGLDVFLIAYFTSPRLLSSFKGVVYTYTLAIRVKALNTTL